MSSHEIIIYGLSAINSLALIMGSIVLNSFRTALTELSQRDLELFDRVAKLEVRVAKMEVMTNDQNRMSHEVSIALEKLRESITLLKENLDTQMRELFQFYDLKKRE